MGIGKAYSYFFYKLYKFWEAASIPKFWSDWKAGLTLDVLEMFLGLSGICYFSVFTKYQLGSKNDLYITIIFIVLIVVPNYFFFNHQDQWKEMVKEFDQWPKKKNDVGTIIAWGIVVAVIGNLILAFYLMSQIDWQSIKQSQG
jgi:Mn2+/Fe2+ NRAMP family transporter